MPYITNGGNLAESFAHLGLRAEFRSRLLNWRKTVVIKSIHLYNYIWFQIYVFRQVGVNDDTLSELSKVQLWLNQNDAMSPSSSFISDQKRI